METKNPRQQALAGASVSIAADTDSLTNITPSFQPADEVSRLRADHLIGRFSVQPGMALAIAALAFDEVQQ